jgi:uncharacterized membrane protein YdjX (TVP38/TMEM64 family)
MSNVPEPRRASCLQLSLRWLPLILICGAMALVYALGWHQSITLERIATHRATLKAFLSDHAVLAPFLYVCLYVCAIALSLPIGFVLTLAGGLLFGWLLGGVCAVVGATIGATIIFLAARSSLGEALGEKAGPWLIKLREGFKDNALSYMLFLRLVPVFPFLLVNLAPAVLGVPLNVYVIGTALGIIPGTFAIASAGAGLDSIIAAAQAEYTACVAARGADLCKLKIHASSLATKELLIAVILGFVALTPVAYKKWRARQESG